MIVKQLDIAITNLCNARCPQCARTNVNGLKTNDWLPLDTWTFEDFERQFPIETLNDVGEYSFCGTWGDPMMCKDIQKIVQYIMDKSNSNVLITTNGSIRNEDFYWNMGILCGKRLSIVFDIDGINEDMHQKYRRGASLKKCLANMSTLSETKSIVLSQTILFKHNQDYIKEIKKLVKDNGSSNHVFYRSDRFENEEGIFTFTNEQGKIEHLERADA